jgi:hypothetical protein
VIVFPNWITFSCAWAMLKAHQKAHVRDTIVSSDFEDLVWLPKCTEGWLTGGIGDIGVEELDVKPHVRCQDILVPSGETAIFEVGLDGHYYIEDEGIIDFRFDYGRVVCPALYLELSLVVQS